MKDGDFLPVIRADEVYTLDAFMERTKCRRSTVDQARRNGLKLCQFGKRRFIRGADFLEYLGTQVVTETGSEDDN